MWLRFTFVCRLLFMNHTNNFFCAVFIPNLWNIVNLNLKVAQFALMYTDLHKDEWVLCVQRNHSPHLFIEGWKLNKKNIKKSRFPQWLGSVAIIQRRDYYYHYFIFFIIIGWEGGCVCVCVFFFIDELIKDLSKMFVFAFNTTLFTREWETLFSRERL